MANERGHYGSNGVSVGQTHTVVVERQGGVPIGTLLLGAVAIGGAVLFARYQSRQIKQLNKVSGLPDQTFTESLRAALPPRARNVYRELTGHPPTRVKEGR